MASYLADFQIVKEMGSRIIPWNPSNVNPASLDLTLGNEWIDSQLPVEKQYTFKADSVTLYPATFTTALYNSAARSPLGAILGLSPRLTTVLAVTRECVDLPTDMAAEIWLKTTPCRLGLWNPIAGWVDPGYKGQLTIMLHAHKKFVLRNGMRIVQVAFSRLDERCIAGYGVKGHYQGSSGPAKAWTNEYTVGLRE